MIRVHCEECDMWLQEVDTLTIDGITLHILLCPECGTGATLVTNTLCETGTKF